MSRRIPLEVRGGSDYITEEPVCTKGHLMKGMSMRFAATLFGVATAAILIEPGPALSQGSDWAEVENDAEAGELVVIVGPVNLPAHAGHHDVEQPPLVTAIVPVDGYIYGFAIEMVDAGGEPITQELLHHVNLIDPDHRELFSPISRRLFAAGSETQPASLPFWLGVPVKEGQRLNISAMFYNPTDTDYPAARLRVVLKYRDEGWIFPMAVYPVYIDVMGYLGEKDFDLPPGRYERSWVGSPAVPGRLLAASGHLHDYALSLRFEDVTEGEILWETEPITDEDGQVKAVPVGKFWWQLGIHLDPEHTYRLTAVYDNPTGATIPAGGMGVLGGVFRPAAGKEWPAADPNSPDYVADLVSTRETAKRRAMGMGEGHGGHDHQQPEQRSHSH